MVLTHFRAAAILTLYRHFTIVEHMQQNKTVKCIDQLSQPTQALLHALDSVQPTGYWKLDKRGSTIIFNPTKFDYNPLRQQARKYILILQDPRTINNNAINFSVRPLCIRSHCRGDEA
jgi:hypothetical protein